MNYLSNVRSVQPSNIRDQFIVYILQFSTLWIILCLALMFLILIQQMMMMTRAGIMKMLARMGVITWTGLADISPH